MDGMFDELTDAEKAYFDSAGETVSEELLKGVEEPAATPEADPEPPAATPEAEPEVTIEADAAEETPEEQPETTPQPEKAPEKVPAWVLKDLREKNRKLEAELEAARAEKARIDAERLAALQPKPPAATPEAEEEPDADLDPIGFERFQRAKLEAQVGALREELTQSKVQTEMGWITTQTKALEADFAAKNPDYAEALEFLTNARLDELRVLYPAASDEQHAQMIQAERGQIVLNSVRRTPTGAIEFVRHPAEAIVALSKSRGFRGKAADAGAATPQSPPAPSKPDPALVAKREAASMTLSGVSGVEGSGPLTVEKLAKMNEAEFAAAMAKDPRLVDRLLGA